jgi:adenosylcobinamide-GDP ribazoletransferase
MIGRELTIFFTAIMFYTRIPCPNWVSHDAHYLNLATRYFPFVGWIVGTICWFVFAISGYLFSTEIALLLSIAAGVGLTGAFHEDGFADVCDGFGGGWTKEKILLIMKDSRVGAYGVVGLVLILLIKFYALFALIKNDIYVVGIMLVTAHTLSRFAAVCIIFTTPYAREDADSKARPVAQQLSVKNFLIALFWVILPIAGLTYLNPWASLVMVPSLFITIYLKTYFSKWIGGYTGDCLGATQQINEVVIYLSFIALWKLL